MDYKQQLKQILRASGWSQEQLAAKLGVSFPALNAWINGRATPRAKAQVRIQTLFLSIVGVGEVSPIELSAAKEQAKRHSFSAQHIVDNRDILDILTLHLTYHTNTIEGSTMTLADVQKVIFDHEVLSNRTAKEQLEATNHQSALYWLLESIASAGGNFSLTEEILQGVHLRLMNGITSDAGQYRRHAVRIMGAYIPLANWQKIPSLITQLIAASNNEGDAIALLARFHAKFEQIHPFSDGNGRTGRLLMLAQSLKAGMAPPIIPKERRQAYYKYLELAQTVGDHDPLEFFIAESIHFAGELLMKK